MICLSLEGDFGQGCIRADTRVRLLNGQTQNGLSLTQPPVFDLLIVARCARRLCFFLARRASANLSTTPGEPAFVFLSVVVLDSVLELIAFFSFYKRFKAYTPAGQPLIVKSS
jgi:hypothetical protein